MPPVLASESIISRLTNRVVPSGVASIKIGVLGPRNVDFGMVVILDAVRVDCVAGVDLIGGEGVLNAAPGQIVIPTVRGKQCTTWSPSVAGCVLGVNDDYSFPVAVFKHMSAIFFSKRLAYHPTDHAH